MQKHVFFFCCVLLFAARPVLNGGSEEWVEVEAKIGGTFSYNRNAASVPPYSDSEQPLV